PLDATLSWKALHDVLRDRSRNVLFNHLGLREDSMGLLIRPDCADLPYFLRAYWAWKMALPFGYTKCAREGAGEGPKCHAWWNIQNLEPPPAPEPPPEQRIASPAVVGMFRAPVVPPTIPPVSRLATLKRLGLAAGFGEYLRSAVADGGHSGTGRTALNADNTDYYPVSLKEDTLRPGTVYVDPYGHVLVLARRVSQTEDAAGLFFAVDAQPDGTVARKRFWRGNFLFAQDPALGGPGFKRFRP